jgi:surfeit locus 1 family protein
MKLNIGNWCFEPKLLTSLLALVFLYLFVSLGVWQLDRAEYKRTIYADFEDRQSAEAIDFNREINNQLDIETLNWRKLNITGEFLEQYQILLDNQVEQTQAGYYVYTPFKLDRSNTIVLVNRGWLVAGTERQTVPDLVFTTQQKINIYGVAKEVPKTGLLLKESPPEKMSNTVFRVQRINIGELEKLTGEKLLPFIIRLEPESEHGYRREWRLPGSGESTNLGYAFQWFAFAAVLLILYLILNIKKIQGKTNE